MFFRNLLSRQILIIIIMTSLSTILFAVDVSFDFAPFTETLKGVVQEYSWTEDSTGELDYKLSELLWDVDFIWTAGLDLTANIEKFVIGAKFSFGIPGESGVLQDSDWLNEVQSQKTHFSEHENHLREYKNFEASFGYEFDLPKNWMIKPFISVTHREFSFDSYDGWYDYPEGFLSGTTDSPYTEVGAESGRDVGEINRGKTISYEQYMQYLSIGAEATYMFSNRIYVSFDAAFLPLVLSSARDNHWSRDMDILESMFGGYGFSGNASASLSINKYFAFNVGIGGTYITNLKGYAFTKSGSGESSDIDDELFSKLEKRYSNPVFFLPYILNLFRSDEIDTLYLGSGAGQMFFSTTLSAIFSW